MNKIIGILKERSVAYFIAAASVICGLVAFIVYLAAGTNNFVTTHSPTVIVPLVLGMVMGVFSLVKTFKLVLLAIPRILIRARQRIHRQHQSDRQPRL